MSGDRRAGLAGVFWSTVNGGASVVLPFAVFILFARIMSPAELAPVLLAVAMLELVKALGPLGVYDVVMRYPEEERRHYESAAALFLASGVVLALVYCALVLVSPLILTAHMQPVLVVLSLKIVFDYLVMQPQVVLARRLAFRRLGSRALTAGIVSGASGIAIARYVSPVLGLSCYYVVQSFVVYAMTVFNSDAAARPRFDREAIREMTAEGARASGVRLSAVAANYLDQMVLSAMIVPAQLGLFNLGKRIEVTAITVVSSFGQMMFQPLFATAAPEDRAAQLGRGVATISLICGVPLVVLALYAGQAVPLVFGAQWAPAAPVVALLGLSGLARAIGGVCGALLTVSGRNALLLKLCIYAAIASVLIILATGHLGLEYVAVGIVLRNIALSWAQFVASKDAEGRLLELFMRNCFVPLAAVAVAALAAGRVAALLVDPTTVTGTLIELACAGIAGGVAGTALLYRRL